jgi:CBS-domain-containing membrane protein
MKHWTVDDVMTKAVVSVDQTTSYRSVVDTLIERRISAVPVVDDFRRVLGVVSEADLLRKVEYAGDEEPRFFEGRRRRGERRKALAGTAEGLMSRPAVTVLAGTSIAAAARKMDAEKVKRVPVVDDLGRLTGVVTRGDLLKVHLRSDDDIRADVEGVLRGTLGVPGEKIAVAVTDGSVVLNGETQLWSTAREAVRLARQVPGTVEVHDRISYSVDDREDYHTGIAFGAA